MKLSFVIIILLYVSFAYKLKTPLNRSPISSNNKPTDLSKHIILFKRIFKAENTDTFNKAIGFVDNSKNEDCPIKYFLPTIILKDLQNKFPLKFNACEALWKGNGGLGGSLIMSHLKEIDSKPNDSRCNLEDFEKLKSTSKDVNMFELFLKIFPITYKYCEAKWNTTHEKFRTVGQISQDNTYSNDSTSTVADVDTDGDNSNSNPDNQTNNLNNSDNADNSKDTKANGNKPTSPSPLTKKPNNSSASGPRSGKKASKNGKNGTSYNKNKTKNVTKTLNSSKGLKGKPGNNTSKPVNSTFHPIKPVETLVHTSTQSSPSQYPQQGINNVIQHFPAPTQPSVIYPQTLPYYQPQYYTTPISSPSNNYYYYPKKPTYTYFPTYSTYPQQLNNQYYPPTHTYYSPPQSYYTYPNQNYNTPPQINQSYWNQHITPQNSNSSPSNSYTYTYNRPHWK